MKNKNLSVHVEICFADEIISHDLNFNADEISLNDVLVSLSEKESSEKMFENHEGMVSLLPGFLMILDKRMIQPWEANNILIRDGQNLKFVRVVAGG